MSEIQNVQQMLEEAKRAAEAGDLASADELLCDVARIQQSELGPLHPELANTMNNLAVVAEMAARFGDAETYYRRSVAIASASLPPDDPGVASSRKNLEDFCRDRGLPLDAPTLPPTVDVTEPPSEAVAVDQPGREEKPAASVEVANAVRAPQAPPPAYDTRPARESAPPRAPDQLPGSVGPTTRSLTMVAIGVVALIAVVLLFMRPWSTGEAPAQDQAGHAAPQTAEPSPAQPTVATPAPVEQPQPPAASRGNRPGASAAAPPSRERGSGNIVLVTSQLCRTLSVGGNWRCDPAGQTVAPGPIVLYTRVKSPRDGVVIHRWYRGSTLRKTARLMIRANATDGYRTFSRQTVKSGEEWRVEVRDTSDAVLYEQRVSVR